MAFDGEKIINFEYRHVERTFYFLVKWQDWEIRYNNWEPLKHLECNLVFLAYIDKLRKVCARNVQQLCAIAQSKPNV